MADTGPTPEAVDPITDNRRKRNMAIGAIAAVLVLLLGVLGAVLLADDDEDGEGVTSGDTTTTEEDEGGTTTARPTTTMRPGGGSGEPDELLVAVDSGGRVVVMDSNDGDVERVLLEDVRVDDPAKNSITVTSDRATAYLTRPSTAGATEPDIVGVRTNGESEPEVLTTGYAPAVSPDGEQLAYVDVAEPTGALLPDPAIVVRDLATGEEHTMARDQQPAFAFISDLAWTADGQWLAFIAGEVETGAWLTSPDAASLDGARRLGPDEQAREEGTAWRAVSAYGDGLAIAEYCCDTGEPERALVILVSIEPAAVEGGLLPDERVEVFRMDSAADAQQLLYVADGGPQGGELFRWTEGSEPHRLADGIIVAAW